MITDFIDFLGNLKFPVILLGVGNRHRGDDAAGSVLAERLRSLKKITVMDTGETPENYTYEVKKVAPKTVLFADAVDVGVEPGQVVFLEPCQLTQQRFSTHRPSLRLVMDYLANETGAQIFLLGMQPKSINPGAPLSAEVNNTLLQLERLFKQLDTGPM